MGGTIHVVSEPGVGSSFRFTARFGLQPQPVRRIEVARRAFGAMPVLVVSQSALNREILTDQLSAQAVRSGQAQTGSEALAVLHAAALRKDPYWWAIIDSSLPDANGVELARVIKSDPCTR
jgi:response regulator RpfG family c-di-GMP phosphodiesterase